MIPLLIRRLPEIIVKYADSKPVLIFCGTRKACSDVATYLAAYWNSLDAKPWRECSQSNVKMSDRAMQGGLFQRGFANDRNDKDGRCISSWRFEYGRSAAD